MTRHDVFLTCRRVRAVIVTRNLLERQESTKQSLFLMYLTHGGPVMMVLKVDSHCRGWDGSSWDTHDAS